MDSTAIHALYLRRPLMLFLFANADRKDYNGYRMDCQTIETKI